MSVWTWAWIAWGIAFLAIEIPAARNRRRGDTLSEHIWRLPWLVRFAALGLLSAHLLGYL